MAKEKEKSEVFGLKVEKKKAELAHEFLLKNQLLRPELKARHEGEFVVFPLQGSLGPAGEKQLKRRLKKFSVLKAEFELKRKKPGTLKEALGGMLSKNELDGLITSFDTVGDIAMIEITRALEPKEKLIGQAVLEVNQSIKTVLKIASAHKGKFRVADVEVIAGQKKTRAVYKESGCTMTVDLAKSFFSPRLSHERARIAAKIKKGEVVGSFFAGVGPFPIVFARKSKMERAFAVELNPHAFKDMCYNIRLNKMEGKIIPVLGDVNQVVETQLAGKCDRVVMPLPHGGEDFLESAFNALKKKEGGVIHFYQFVEKKAPYGAPLRKVRAVAKKLGKKIKVLNKRQVRSFSPARIQVVIDFQVK